MVQLDMIGYSEVSVKSWSMFSSSPCQLVVHLSQIMNCLRFAPSNVHLPQFRGSHVPAQTGN